MKPSYRKAARLLLWLFLLVVLAVTACAWHMLDYALKPGGRGRDEAAAWHEMDSLYPGLAAWRDSLRSVGAWHDTLITAADGTPLHAYYVPADSPTARTAVLVHGYTDCAVRMMHLGRMYRSEMKANILLPDLRNAGKSGGDHIQMGWFDRYDVKQWVRTVPEIFGDSAEIVVHGISMGAATTMMLSGDADVPPAVKAYVEDCGYTSVDRQFEKELRAQFRQPRWPMIPAASALCYARYGWTFGEASALKQVERCSRPMFFIHGSADDYVPTQMVYPLFAAHPGPKCLWVVPGATHARSYFRFPQEYARRVSRFVSDYAGGAWKIR